ncbi:hypothetical protein [Okeania sp.]|uniref:hypothetical protein n=1 Tax=Okeania sp. TaxID=3100323 RepID=UPI002B4B74C9|nr:hypothetical protein [Okeania sp.]MEB3339423.1 hypothetical protein [Okeania sp.]
MWEQEEIIDNLWIRIDLIFYFWRCLLELLGFSVGNAPQTSPQPNLGIMDYCEMPVA